MSGSEHRVDREGDHRARLDTLRALLDRRGDAAAFLTTQAQLWFAITAG